MGKKNKLRSIEDFAKPKQILFPSADIVGSTALKHKSSAIGDIKRIPDSEDWAHTIQSFYNGMVQNLSRRWKDPKIVGRMSTLDMGSPPIVWKTVGDEIIFRKHITDHRQVYAMMRAWKGAIADVRHQLSTKPQNNELDLKSTAWIAEFPLQNKVIIASGWTDENLAKSSMQDLIGRIGKFEDDPVPSATEIDFIGPAIDVGFRISKMSTYRKFVISIDVAYFLARCAEIDANKCNDLSIQFDGMEYFKGVFGGLHYPIFWIDMVDEKDKSCIDEKTLEWAQDKLMKREPVEVPQLINFLNSYYRKAKNFIERPFILGDRQTAPENDNYELAMNALIDLYREQPRL
jgi:hypothetical protein